MLKAICFVAALAVMPFATGIAEAHNAECAPYGCNHGVQSPLPASLMAIICGAMIGGFLIYAATKMTAPPRLGYC